MIAKVPVNFTGKLTRNLLQVHSSSSLSGWCFYGDRDYLTPGLIQLG